ncbi:MULTISPECIES: PhzF family phenazine biosynthesis protein [Pseudoxanthomonas]|uniref:PhzF family phenazine biosynthesis protein n=1 Tax=Pseudoxanthomonas taiwanensis J19 TaxID=935569 RepID=A0A562D8B7_9GAMM|nr:MULTISPECIES: PhzF family phenazine biosynthesis protein [Pseudoxanthomonas]RRN80654.1 PhzF family phenazine biosynthesis protein [Pseudoxanthomonas sp. SGD-10]TWH05868.1 PhzF family phenazine biosynthesis protein [Pseudoxanthomonas taiwanensis J19]
MPTRRFLQLDVFAHAPGAGNPLAVMLDAEGLDEARMQAFAAWTNLSETIFFLPPTTAQADYRVRIFTPVMELPFAGHPSVGAAWAAVDAGLARPRAGRLVQECAAGLLPVRADQAGDALHPAVRSPRAQRRDLAAPDWLLADTVFGARRGALPPALWNNGPDWWLLELADAAAVRGLRPDLGAIAALPGKGKLAVFAPGDGEADLVVRAFAPGVGIPEDPATGSVNALVAAALHRAGRLPGRGGRYLASQGRELGRDARLRLEVDGDGEVWVGGPVQAVIRGTVDW